MLAFLKKYKSKVIYSTLLILVLVLIRMFENQLFYDPFLNYFSSEYANLPFPKFNIFKLFFSLGFRFYLNMVISLGLLYVLFDDRKIVKFSIFLFMLLGSILLISFFFVLTFFAEESKMTLFYIRRFLIQPIFILLFIPGFYYQKIAK
ncbi:MAG TPA: exosortase F system-associated protein [Flavobacterium sp.]|jgi:exosortase F-associated protein|uniref:exosortase F system-associated membrane protein n=1 Tax=Flavobacterium sp. TaxID=239 RepID=UPI002D00FDA7|nr:exosortase F system-associated protein [Flavobacterium sp.]HPW97196.1 exosortase F system-associated protein [Flavobacterium sp.]HQA73715.1 exosortase F system-associated protein [Flavobacterium sp.]